MNHLFLLILTAISLYFVVSAALILKRIRQFATGSKPGLSASRKDIVELYGRSIRLRQILAGTFYLFGFTFFCGIQNVPTAETSRELIVVQILSNFEVQFVYAANVFAAFLILHLVQWFTSSRVQNLAQRN